MIFPVFLDPGGFLGMFYLFIFYTLFLDILVPDLARFPDLSFLPFSCTYTLKIPPPKPPFSGSKWNLVFFQFFGHFSLSGLYLACFDVFPVFTVFSIFPIFRAIFRGGGVENLGPPSIFRVFFGLFPGCI